MKATYTKLRDGSWGIRVEGTVTAGQIITVTKKSGESERKTVGKVVWSGNGISICTVADTVKSSSYTPKAGKRQYRDCDDFCQGCRLCR